MSRAFKDGIGSVSLVTGGASGIGCGLAEALLAEGAKVSVTYMNSAI